MDAELVFAILSTGSLVSLLNGLVNRRRSNADINKINADIERSRRQDLRESEKKVDDKIARLIDDQREEIDALNGHILNLQKESKEAKAREIYLENEIDKLKVLVETYRDQATRRKEENKLLKEQVEVLKKTFRGLS